MSAKSGKSGLIQNYVTMCNDKKMAYLQAVVHLYLCLFLYLYLLLNHFFASLVKFLSGNQSVKSLSGNKSVKSLPNKIYNLAKVTGINFISLIRTICKTYFKNKCSTWTIYKMMAWLVVHGNLFDVSFSFDKESYI